MGMILRTDGKRYFESSYFHWLTLAKVHQIITTVISDLIINFEELHTKFEEIETDPLAPLRAQRRTN